MSAPRRRPLLYARTCRGCGCRFGATFYNVARCPTCLAAHRREYQRLYQQRRRADPAVREADAARQREAYHLDAPANAARERAYRRQREKARRFAAISRPDLPEPGVPESADPLFKAKDRPCGKCGKSFTTPPRWRYFCEACRRASKATQQTQRYGFVNSGRSGPRGGL